MPRDENRRLTWFRCARKRMFFDNLLRPREQHLRHAFMRAHGAAVIQRLRFKPRALGCRPHLHPIKPVRPLLREPKLPRNDFLRKVSFTNKERHHKNPRCKRSPQHRRQTRLLFPKPLQYLPKNSPAPQLIRMLIRRPRRLRVQRRSMTHQHQRCVLILPLHSRMVNRPYLSEQAAPRRDHCCLTWNLAC
jgi:hypothetical protein